MTGGKRSRNKGAGGELELARILAKHGFNARRTPNSGGLAIKGDLTAIDGAGPAIPGFHLEGKRCETLRIPDWLRQAHADAGGLVPLVAFRRNKTRATVDPLGEWHALLPLEALLGLLRELEELRGVRGAVRVADVNLSEYLAITAREDYDGDTAAALLERARLELAEALELERAA